MWFDGSLAMADGGAMLRPAFGRLVLGDWPTPPVEDPDRPLPPESVEPSGTDDPTATASLSPVRSSARPRTVFGPPSPSPGPDPAAQVIETGAIGDWDARWDSTGTRLAVWISDGVDPTIGRLNLYQVDPATGRFLDAERPVADVPALRGFSIADGRLAWVTPPGQDGEGSRVQIIAWTAEEFGSVETLPAEEWIVVIR